MLGAVQGFIRFADSPSSASSSSSSSTAAVTRDVDLVFNIIDGDAKARKAVALMQERFPDVAIYAVRCGSHIVHNAAQAVCTAIGLGRYVSSGQDNSFLYWAIEKSIIVARSLSGELMAHIAAHGMPSELIQTRWASLFAAAASLCGDRRRSLLLALITIDARDHQSGDVYSSTAYVYCVRVVTFNETVTSTPVLSFNLPALLALPFSARLGCREELLRRAHHLACLPHAVTTAPIVVVAARCDRGTLSAPPHAAAARVRKRVRVGGVDDGVRGAAAGTSLPPLLAIRPCP